MRLPSRTDYALRAALELAASSQGPVTTDEIGRRQSIPASYLGSILAELRRAGIVRARRGPEGGWTLSAPAEEVSLASVIRAVDGALSDVGGQRPENLAYSGVAGGLQAVFVAVRAAEREILDSVTLADVVAQRFSPRVRSLLDNPDAWH